MTEERTSKAWATIRITEEVMWKLARWLLVGVCAVIVRYAPLAWDHLRELERMPSLRGDIAALQSASIEHAVADRELRESLRERADLDIFVLERLVSFEAADAEPRRERKAEASAYAVRAYREALAEHRSPREALLLARTARFR